MSQVTLYTFFHKWIADQKDAPTFTPADPVLEQCLILLYRNPLEKGVFPASPPEAYAVYKRFNIAQEGEYMSYYTSQMLFEDVVLRYLMSKHENAAICYRPKHN